MEFMETVHETTHSPKVITRDGAIILTFVGRMMTITIALTIPNNKTMVTYQGMRVAIHLTSNKITTNKVPTNKGHNNTKITVKLAEEVHTREAGKLSSYPDLNSKHKPGGPEHVNMVTSLQNGKTYNNDIKIPSVYDFSHDVEDFVTDDEIFVEDFPKPPTQNFEVTESPKDGEGGVSSTTTPYLAALEKPASARLAKKGPHSEDMWETFKQ
nr:hypothetical protein [Tanacetum cinerariifolium]